MTSNTYKNKAAGRSKRRGVFSFIESKLNVECFFEDGLPIGLLPPVLFLTLLCIIYIGSLHHAEKNIRKIGKLEVQVEDLRADYTTLKADYMKASKQSEVALKAANLGLRESKEPPIKIVINEDEY